MQSELHIRWLGVQGVELNLAGNTLLIDPFVTRPPLWRFFSRVPSDEALAARLVPRASWILVTHPHYDHLLDVPGIARRTGGRVYGSPNTAAILALHGLPPGEVRRMQAGDRFTLGPFTVEVLPSRHIDLPFNPLVNGPLRPGLRLPLRPSDYRMDVNFGFFILADGVRILFCPGPSRPCDVLFAAAARYPAELRRTFEQSRPALFIPLHWDNFFRPLTQPPQEMLLPGRLRLAGLARLLAQVSPGTKMLIPEMFAEKSINQQLAISN